ncbi:MAG: hypothetical protein WD604_01780 [Balneolaceae bacterium]
MNYYRRKLPHIQVRGGEYFVTFRLKGSLPKHIIRELKEEQKKFREKLKTNSVSRSEKKAFDRQVFLMYDESLDFCETGPVWLKSPAVAKAVQEAIHYRNGKQ